MSNRWPSGVPVINYAGEEYIVVEVHERSFETICVNECRFCDMGGLCVVNFDDAAVGVNGDGRAMLAIAKESK